MVENVPNRETAMRVWILALAATAAIVVAIAFHADPATALEIRTFSATPSLTQAGGHPDLVLKYAGETRDSPMTTDPCQCNDPKDIDISLPTGFIGNPHSTPQCKAADFARNQCAADSQVGVFSVLISNTGGLALEITDEPVYNLVPRPNQAGLLGVVVTPGLFNVPIYSVIGARTDSDYGLDARTDGLERQFVPQKFTYTLWGVPADDIHTPLRRSSAEAYDEVPSNSPKIPFLINPSTCNASSESVVNVTGYDNSVSSATSAWPASTGCDQLTFNPSLSARPTTTETDSPSGVDINLTVPQLLSPTFPSPSQIKATTVTLPEGFSINPNAADGKTSCSDAEANLGTLLEAGCPEFAKVGTDTIDSAALPAPISGGIYLADPRPGSRYRLILTADGFGTHIKLAGRVDPDPATGKLVASFEDLPQAPLTTFNLHFFGAERGLLATPARCGTYAVESTFTPWDEVLANQSSTQFFVLESGPEGAGCPGSSRPFAPGFSAASTGNVAGSHSPFVIDMTRNDGDQNLSGVTLSAPPGFTATLAGIPYCSDPALSVLSAGYTGLGELATPSCPAASQVGTSITGAGAGSRPIHLNGKVYLAGPYKGAPLSLVVVTPGVSGPYDLGNVAVRVAVYVDPVDAHVTAVSDPLPLILEGVLLRLRTIRVNLDRPNFTLNPTNCGRFEVGASILGDEGGVADRASHYQVANCANLPFSPQLELRMRGGIRRRGHPAIHGVLTADPGEANARKISVTLPKGELLDNAHIGTVCTRVQFGKNDCPPRSLLGRASVATPLLDQPLRGKIYLRSSAHQLPDLALDLEGQVDFEAAARIDSVHRRLRASFETVPDIPFSRIVVDLAGGSKGLVQNSESLCDRSKAAKTQDERPERSQTHKTDQIAGLLRLEIARTGEDTGDEDQGKGIRADADQGDQQDETNRLQSDRHRRAGHDAGRRRTVRRRTAGPQLRHPDDWIQQARGRNRRRQRQRLGQRHPERADLRVRSLPGAQQTRRPDRWRSLGGRLSRPQRGEQRGQRFPLRRDRRAGTSWRRSLLRNQHPHLRQFRSSQLLRRHGRRLRRALGSNRQQSPERLLRTPLSLPGLRNKPVRRLREPGQLHGVGELHQQQQDHGNPQRIVQQLGRRRQPEHVGDRNRSRR